MSFGFSIGDFIAVPAFAYRVYKLCKDSTAEFQDVSGLVISLHCVLKEVARFSDDLDPDQQEQLVIVGSRCHDVLKELERLLIKYATLSTKKFRIWDKLRWGLEDVKAIKGRLVESTILLNSLNTTFINSSQGRVEVKLDKYTAEIRAGRRNGSILSCRSMESLVSHDGQTWSKLRKELEAIGISAPVLEQHQQFIITWFDEAVSVGALKQGFNAVEVEQGPFAHRSASYTTEDTNWTGATKVAEWAEAEGPRHGSHTQASTFDENDKWRKNDNLEECLQTAIRNQKLAWVEELQKCEQTTTLHEAVLRADIAVVQLLLSRGANVNIRDSSMGGKTPLHTAALTGDRKFVELLVDAGADLEAVDNENQNALYTAVVYKKRSVVQLLLDRGINVEHRERVKQTTIHAAASAGDELTMQLLLNKGANVEVTDHWEQTALHVAAAYRKEAIVQLLLGQGADHSARNIAKCTALHIASDGSYESNGSTTNQRETIIAHLLDSGADVESNDKKRNTPLHYAALEGNVRILQLLLDRGANLEAKCGDGKPALHNAAQRLRPEAVQLLLDRGADCKVKDVFGRTAADYVVFTTGDSAATRAVKATITQVLDAAMEEVGGGHGDYLSSTADGFLKEPVVRTADISNSECIALAYWPTALGM